MAASAGAPGGASAVASAVASAGASAGAPAAGIEANIEAAAAAHGTPDTAAQALGDLLRLLQARGYRFSTVTPATQARVNARPGNAWAWTVEDVFGWSRPFDRSVLPPELFDAAHAAGVLLPAAPPPAGAGAGNAPWRLTVRVSCLRGGPLFLHSAWPTTEPDAVFFGPDTHRFAAAIERHLDSGAAVARAVDIGCGAGPGAIVVALRRPQAEVLAVDINDRALAMAAVNARAAGVRIAPRRSNLLGSVEGRFDLIVANPPYLLDASERAYRHGGGSLGEGLSLAIAALAGERLAPGGTLLLYTGSAVVAGHDRLHAALQRQLAGGGLAWSYEELDPDVFGEELLEPAYAEADRIAAVLLTVRRPHAACN